MDFKACTPLSYAFVDYQKCWLACMTIDSSPFSKPLRGRSRAARRSELRGQQTVAEMKTRQSARIREIKQILVTVGIATLEEQAKVLGLGRSTTWSVLKAN